MLRSERETAGVSVGRPPYDGLPAGPDDPEDMAYLASGPMVDAGEFLQLDFLLTPFDHEMCMRFVPFVLTFGLGADTTIEEAFQAQLTSIRVYISSWLLFILAIGGGFIGVAGASDSEFANKMPFKTHSVEICCGTVFCCIAVVPAPPPSLHHPLLTLCTSPRPRVWW
jgi:hypothetical protein